MRRKAKGLTAKKRRLEKRVWLKGGQKKSRHFGLYSGKTVKKGLQKKKSRGIGEGRKC